MKLVSIEETPLRALRTTEKEFEWKRRLARSDRRRKWPSSAEEYSHGRFKLFLRSSQLVEMGLENFHFQVHVHFRIERRGIEWAQCQLNFFSSHFASFSVKIIKMGPKNVHFQVHVHFRIERRGIEWAGCQINFFPHHLNDQISYEKLVTRVMEIFPTVTPIQSFIAIWFNMKHSFLLIYIWLNPMWASSRVKFGWLHSKVQIWIDDGRRRTVGKFLRRGERGRARVTSLKRRHQMESDWFPTGHVGSILIPSDVAPSPGLGLGPAPLPGTQSPFPIDRNRLGQIHK